MPEDAVSYGVLPTAIDGRARHVFFTYIGEGTPALKRGRAAIHAPHVEAFFEGTVGALPALTTAHELDASYVEDLLARVCKDARQAVVR